MSEPLRTLIVEDRASDATLVIRELERAGLDPKWNRVDTEDQYVTQLETSPDLILADYNVPNFGAMRALEVLRSKGLDIPLIIVSGSIGEDVAVEAMRLGAADYLLKDRLGRLGPAVHNALEQSRWRKERKRVALELRSAHEQLRHLLEYSPAVIYSLKIEKDRVTPTVVSDNIERLLGITAEESTYDWWVESLHPDDRERVVTKLRDSLSGQGYSMEYRLRHKDGSYHWVEDNNRIVRDASGKATESVGVWTDITERKLSEQANRASVERFELFMDNLPGIAWIKDRDYRYVYANKSCRQLSIGGREWFGKSDEELWPAELAATYKANDRQVVETKEPQQIVETILCKGEKRDAISSKFPILNDAGEVAFVCGIGIDITERKRAEEQMREQARLLDLTHDAIMVRDMEDRVEYWNHGAEELYGWTAAEVHCRPVSSFLSEDDPGAGPAARTAVLENGIWTGECKHRSKSGGTVTVRSRWTLVRDELEAPESILIINTDITEQKKIEGQLLQAQRLESIGTLASGVAHDLNNILAPILMGTALLSLSDIPAADKALLSTMESCAQRGADIVKQVLTFARGAEGARLLLQPAHLVRDMAQIVEQTFPKTIAVRMRFPDSLWLVEGDPTQLHQVLLNLSVNARDAMPAGGALTLSAENFSVDEHYASMTPGAKPGPHVLFEVNDTGMGIPRQIIDKIFDPFFTTKELGQGTGLGLSTMIGIVKSHGGFVGVYSEIGRGTTFKIYLPATMDVAAAAKEKEATVQPPANGELLLIVDDEKPILHVAQALLESHGYQVLTAEDATEALAIFAMRMNEIDLVLTDLAMPLMDGMALIRTLQKMKPTVRIVASTGRGGQDEHANEMASLNVRACLTKPYNKGKLLATLHDVLHQTADNHSSQALELETNTLQTATGAAVRILGADNHGAALELEHSLEGRQALS